MKNKPTRGRPPLPKGTTATSQIQLRATTKRKAAYVRKASKDGKTLAAWMFEHCDKASGYAGADESTPSPSSPTTMSKHTSIRAVKQITVYITSLANHNPSLRGYTVSLSDPDAGHTGARTFSSGYAVPCPVFIPRDWKVAESGGGEEFLFDPQGRPWQLQWDWVRGVMIATVSGHSVADQLKNGTALFLKSLSREALGV